MDFAFPADGFFAAVGAAGEALEGVGKKFPARRAEVLRVRAVKVCAVFARHDADGFRFLAKSRDVFQARHSVSSRGCRSVRHVSDREKSV